MRKPTSVLLFTSLIAFASGSALALGDRAKEKKASDSQTMTQPSSSTTAPGSAPSPHASTKATTDGAAASPPAQTPGQTASATGTTMSASDGAKPTKNKESRCDETKYASKSAMPADCVDKNSAGAGSSGASAGAGSAGGASGSAAGSSGGSSK